MGICSSNETFFPAADKTEKNFMKDQVKIILAGGSRFANYVLSEIDDYTTSGCTIQIDVARYASTLAERNAVINLLTDQSWGVRFKYENFKNENAYKKYLYAEYKTKEEKINQYEKYLGDTVSKSKRKRKNLEQLILSKEYLKNYIKFGKEKADKILSGEESKSEHISEQEEDEEEQYENQEEDENEPKTPVTPTEVEETHTYTKNGHKIKQKLDKMNNKIEEIKNNIVTPKSKNGLNKSVIHLYSINYNMEAHNEESDLEEPESESEISDYEEYSRKRIDTAEYEPEVSRKGRPSRRVSKKGPVSISRIPSKLDLKNQQDEIGSKCKSKRLKKYFWILYKTDFLDQRFAKQDRIIA